MASYTGLSTGAGAAEGLETLLTRMRADEEAARRGKLIDSNISHQVSSDAIAGRAATRADTSADIANDRGRAQNDMVRQITGLLRGNPDAVGAQSGVSDDSEGADLSNRGNSAPTPAPRQVSGMSRVEDLNNPAGRGMLDLAGMHPNDMFGSVPQPPRPRTENLSSEDEYLDQWAKDHGKPNRLALTAKENQQASREMAQAKHIDSPVVIQTAGGDYGQTQIVPKRAGATYDRPAPAQTASRADSARRVASHLNDVISEAQQLDKIGLMGPIGGRWSDFGAGKWGSAADVGQVLGRPLSPQEEELLGQFRADTSLLKSGIAMVHGGARGGGSIQMVERFDKLMNSGKMDLPTFTGAAKSFGKWLNAYADLTPSDSKQPDPGDNPSPAGDLYDQYLKRNAKPGGGGL